MYCNQTVIFQAQLGLLLCFNRRWELRSMSVAILLFKNTSMHFKKKKIPLETDVARKIFSLKSEQIEINPNSQFHISDYVRHRQLDVAVSNRI